MQTFLPFPDFIHTAKILDDKRLGKQRVEAKQILIALETGRGSWVNHTATRMWRGYEEVLGYYMNIMIAEWIHRGKENNMFFYIPRASKIVMPPWMGDFRLHESHRANLARKDPEYYGKLWPYADKDAPYWWPCGMKDKKKHKIMEDYWNAVHTKR